MTPEKRPRGRPRGSGKNDTPYLAQVADLMVSDPSLKPTTAMKRVMLGHKWTETDQTLIRRWQVKWKADGVSLLAAARERARPKSIVYASKYYPRTATEQLMEQQRRMQDLIDPPHMRVLREYEQHMRDLIDPPYMRWFREQEQRMRNFVDPPYMRELRRMDELRRQLYQFNI